MYPTNDHQFRDTVILVVSALADGWSIEEENGWAFFVPADSPVKPKAGMLARFYGRGIGFPVRGLFLAGKKVFYRTAEEDQKHQANQLYGANASEWLARWDAGQNVWTIEMGGLGPGYEQAIQITVAEILRHLLATNYDAAKLTAKREWEADRRKIEDAGFANERIKALGLSAAQWGAALSLALHLYLRGPQEIMDDPATKKRRIQCNRCFPVPA